MELVSKIFETLEISQLALLQLGLVVVLAFLLSTLLIRPILRTFEERENLSVKPIEESRRILVEADEKARGYDEALRKGAAEALARKRRVMEEASRAGRGQIDAVVEETNLKVEELKGRISSEKESAAAFLRDQVAQLSAEIARKVLGRPVA
jgi:F-type H+-transporting ATPase subunit b